MAASVKPEAKPEIDPKANGTAPEAEVILPGQRPRAKTAGARTGIPDPEASLGSSRPAGKTGPKSRSEQIGGLAEQIYGMHQLASMMTGLHSLVITDKQAIALAGPIIDVAKKWNIPLTIDGMPELQLLATAAAIYVPLAATLQMEINARKAKSAHPEDQSGDPSAARTGPEVYGPEYPPGPQGHGPLQ